MLWVFVTSYTYNIRIVHGKMQFYTTRITSNIICILYYNVVCILLTRTIVGRYCMGKTKRCGVTRRRLTYRNEYQLFSAICFEKKFLQCVLAIVPVYIIYKQHTPVCASISLNNCSIGKVLFFFTNHIFHTFGKKRT